MHRIIRFLSPVMFITFLSAGHAVAQSGDDSLIAGIRKGKAEFEAGNYRKAEQLLSAAIKEARLDSTAGRELALALTDLGEVYRIQERLEEAEQSFEEALITSRKLQDKDLQITLLNNLGTVFLSQDRPNESEEAFQMALATLNENGSPDSLLYADIADNLGDLMAMIRKLDVAEARYREAYEIRRKHSSEGQKVRSSIADSLNNIATVASYRGDYETGEAMYRRALEAMEESLGPAHPRVGTVLQNLGWLCRQRHEYEDAEPYLRRALQIFRAALPPEHPWIARTLVQLGDTLMAEAKYDESEVFLRQALAVGRRAFASNDAEMAVTLETYAHVLERLNRTGEAKPIGEEAMRIRASLNSSASAGRAAK